MNMRYFGKSCAMLIAITSAGMVAGCANMEVNTGRGNIPGHYIRYEMQEADRAVETARQAGKDKICPAEFKAAEDAKNNAYDVFRSCRTEEGAALAKQATQKANALCPPRPVAATLTITPTSIKRGESAQLSWTSENADECTITPSIGKVAPQGSMMVTPGDTTSYSIVCTGTGGKADSASNIGVTMPAPPPPPVIVPEPVVEAAQPKAAPVKTCDPIAVNVQFDTNKAVIKPKYHDELKKIADFLNEFPKATSVIEGHTDSVGSKAANIKLSQRRAESVRSYLIANFKIAPERLTAKGFGPEKPVADNKTAAGKQKNRRIEASFNCEGN